MLLLLISLRIFQWLVPLIGLFFIYRVVSQFRNGKRLLAGTLLWVFFWLVIGVLAMKPDFISESLAKSLGFASHINAVIFVALGFLFMITYYQSSTIDGLEKKMTELVRNMALDKQKEIDKLKKELKEQKKKSHSKKEPSQVTEK